MLYGGIEAGGTKIVCAVGTGPTDLRAQISFPTTTPSETLAQIITFFQQQQLAAPLAAIGIGSFGPISLDHSAPDYGYITSTPKPGWRQTDIAGTIERALGVSVGFDTDVNAAALGEGRWGAAQGLTTFLYLTIGTGIGGGGLSNDQLMHGLLHPEMGHIRLPHDMQTDPFPGICPYHGDCLEGLASGPALKARWGVPAETLSSDHPAWALEARYLALACVNFICMLSPQRIMLGGGVMSQSHLFPLIRQGVQALLNEYIAVPAILQHIDAYIVPPALGSRVGVLGALALAEQVAGKSPARTT
ncbi:MAG: ROK family protein [Ktedonobacteraceae bacterium]